MKIRFLGAHNTESSVNGMTCLLLDDHIALDAGSLTRHLTLQQQLSLRGVLLTHQHYDHIRDIPALTMNCFLNNGVMNAYGSQAVYSALEQHFLNEEIYSRFLANQTLHFTVVPPSITFRIDDYDITPVAVNHAVPTQGYLVKKLGRSFFYTGDTGPGLETCWQKVQPDLLITEVTSPNHFSDFGRTKGHLTPLLLQEELQLFRAQHGYLPRVITIHMNPSLESEIATELRDVASALSCAITPAHEGYEVSV
jgi:ribonuclease BN (tRNA processing enzyme)